MQPEKHLASRSLLTTFVISHEGIGYSEEETYQLGKTKIFSYRSCQYH